MPTDPYELPPIDSVEMDRWDNVQLSSQESTQLDEALNTNGELLLRTSPGNSHRWLTRAQNHLLEAYESLKRAGKRSQ